MTKSHDRPVYDPVDKHLQDQRPRPRTTVGCPKDTSVWTPFGEQTPTTTTGLLVPTRAGTREPPRPGRTPLVVHLQRSTTTCANRRLGTSSTWIVTQETDARGNQTGQPAPRDT